MDTIGDTILDITPAEVVGNPHSDTEILAALIRTEPVSESDDEEPRGFSLFDEFDDEPRPPPPEEPSSDNPSKLPTDIGYPSDCFISPVEDYLMCNICQEVVRDPINLETCPHLFCRKCILGVKTRQCPNCRVIFPAKPLAGIPFLTQMIFDKKIKCIYHEKGCGWTGVLGTDDRTLNDHLEKCEWGGFEPCPQCSKKVQKASMDDHLKSCPENEAECKYCLEKMKRNLLIVHTSIGEVSGRWCENRYKCLYPECDAAIKKEDRKRHAIEECKKRIVICYGCEKLHTIPAFSFGSHIKEKVTTIEDALKFINKSSVPQDGEIGSIVEISIDRPEGGWQLAEIIGKRIDASMEYEPHEAPNFEIEVRTLLENTSDEDKTSWTSVGNVVKMGTYTQPTPDFIEPQEMKEYVKDCLKRCECTITEVPHGSYEFQPFYKCVTCCGEYRYGIGCCAVCASLCHAGHKLVLELGSGGSFCDCGGEEMRDTLGRIVKCCAPRPKKEKTEEEKKAEEEEEKLDTESHNAISAMFDTDPRPLDEVKEPLDDIVRIDLEVADSGDVVASITFREKTPPVSPEPPSESEKTPESEL